MSDKYTAEQYRKAEEQACREGNFMHAMMFRQAARMMREREVGGAVASASMPIPVCTYKAPDGVTDWPAYSFEQMHEFAARRAAVPDVRALHVLKPAADEPQFDPEDFTSVDTRLYFWRTGWNACREAMLAAAPEVTK